MKAALFTYSNKQLSAHAKNEELNATNVQLVLAFGAKDLLAEENIYALLRSKYSSAHIALCSTAGEIYHDAVMDNSVSISVFEFEKTALASVNIKINDFANSYDAGVELMQQLKKDDLAYVLVLSDGSMVNGSELVRGINPIAGNIPVSGGLAGDATNFHSTLVGLNGEPSTGNIVAIGFYGNSIQVSHGSMGGWDMFGLERTVTKSTSNQLFEIDNKNALELYKMYLGNYAEQLPSSALLFPLSVLAPGSDEAVVRTILKIDEETSSMIFAGDIPEGSQVRFMKANFDRLIDAATNAASMTLEAAAAPPKIALLISCVGRKVILGTRTEEEVEAVAEIFWNNTLLTGFYSYGEISPFTSNSKCELHNQTMTITTFNEN